MDKFIISRITTSGARQYMSRAFPVRWSYYECNAMVMSDRLSSSVLKILFDVRPHGVFERHKYHPPKLP